MILFAINLFIFKFYIFNYSIFISNYNDWYIYMFNKLINPRQHFITWDFHSFKVIKYNKTTL